MSRCHAQVNAQEIYLGSIQKSAGIDVTLHAEFNFDILFGRGERECAQIEFGLMSRCVTLASVHYATGVLLVLRDLNVLIMENERTKIFFFVF